MMDSSKKPIDPAAIPALLRSALANDAEGARVILDGCDPIEMVLALCAFTNQQCTAYMDGDRERWDAALAEVQRQMSGL
jgi:hypothetical protein